MTRPSRPAMIDPADRDTHSKDGVAPYPTPHKTEVVGEKHDDVEDPANVDADAPHDRGDARDGGYTTGTDSMKKKLDEDHVRGAWKRGETQGKP